MEINNKLKPTGYINIKLISSDGIVKDERNIHNLIVDAGKNALAAWLVPGTQSDYFMRYIALGTGSAAAQASDTTLNTEAGTRVAGALSSSSNQLTVQATIPSDGVARAIVEAGLFSALVVGTLFARQTFAVINKGVSDSLQVTWRVTLS